MPYHAYYRGAVVRPCSEGSIMMTGFRTYLAAVLAVILGGGAAVGWWDVSVIADNGSEVLVAMGVVMAALRTITKTGPGQPQ